MLLALGIHGATCGLQMCVPLCLALLCLHLVEEFFFSTMRFSLLLPWLSLPCYALIDVVRVTLWLLLLFFLLAYKGISVD